MNRAQKQSLAVVALAVALIIGTMALAPSGVISTLMLFAFGFAGGMAATDFFLSRDKESN